MSRSRASVLLVAVAALVGCKPNGGAPPAPSASSSAPIAPVASAEVPSDAPLGKHGTRGVVFSPDGARMVAGNQVFDLGTGKLIATLASGRHGTFSPDGSAFLSADREQGGEPLSWQIERIGSRPIKVVADSAEWLTAGATVVSRKDQKVSLHVASSALPIDLGAVGSAVEMASSDRTLVLSDDTGLVIVDLATATPRPRVKQPIDGMRQVAVVDENIVVCGGTKVSIASVATPGEGRTVKLDAVARGCHGKASFVFVETAVGVTVIDVRSAAILAQRPRGFIVSRVVPSADGRYFHADLVAYDVDHKREVRVEGDNPVWAPGKPRVAVERESSVAVFDASSDGRVVAWLRGALVPWRERGTPWLDDDTIATVHDDALTIWRLPDAKPRLRVPLRARRTDVRTTAFGGVQLTKKYLTYFASVPTESGAQTEVALVRLSDLATIWWKRTASPSGALSAVDRNGTPASVEGFLE